MAQTGTPADKSRFFLTTPEPRPITDVEHLQNWSRRIVAWVEHVENRLRTLESLTWEQKMIERDNMLNNRHVTMLYRPSFDEYQCLYHIGVHHPLALQELQGFLRFADAAYERLDEGPAARDALAGALWELRCAIDATVKGLEAAKQGGAGKGSGRIEEGGERELHLLKGVAYWGQIKLDVPMGKAVEVFEKLVENLGEPVTYADLGCEGKNPKEADDQTKQAVSRIKTAFQRAKVPYDVANLRRVGYCMQAARKRKTKSG